MSERTGSQILSILIGLGALKICEEDDNFIFDETWQRDQLEDPDYDIEEEQDDSDKEQDLDLEEE